MLQGLFAIAEALQQGLPFRFQGVEALLHGLFLTAVLQLLAPQFFKPFGVLPQPLLQLLLFLLKWFDAGLQLLSPFAATLLFVQPGPRSTGDIRQPPP